MIASKVPKASDLAQSRDRPRKRFTAAAFGVTFWPRKRLHKKENTTRRVVRATASARGGPLFAFAHCASPAGCDPKFAPKISKNPPKTRKIAKKSMQFVVRFNYLYYFWGKRSVEMRRESHCCRRKPEKFTSLTAIRRCPISGR